MPEDKMLWPRAAAWLAGANANIFYSSAVSSCADEPYPTAQDITTVLTAAGPEPEAQQRMAAMAYAAAATLPDSGCAPRLSWPAGPCPALDTLLPTRADKEPLLHILDNLNALRQSCEALPAGTFTLLQADNEVLHFTRTGQREVLHVFLNRGSHLLLGSIGEKSVELNPRGFTITVEELGHNANHSYYDYK